MNGIFRPIQSDHFAAQLPPSAPPVGLWAKDGLVVPDAVACRQTSVVNCLRASCFVLVCFVWAGPLAAAQGEEGGFKIAATAEDQFCLSWLAENLRPYQIESSPDLVSWTDCGATRVGTGEILEEILPRQAPQAFFRLRKGAVRPGFETLAMSRGDDHSYPQFGGVPIPVDLGFTIRLFEKTYSTCYVNNNGNITFDLPLFVYTPESLIKKQSIMIAPFWADVDSRNLESGVTRFSEQPQLVAGHRAFGVTWRNVGYFSQHIEKLNTFQLLLIERSDRNAGDFDVEFNYNQIEWETGDASGGSNGIGGAAARVGWTNGMGLFMEYRGSGESLALLDRTPATGMPNQTQGLIYQTWNSGIPGRIVIPVVLGIPQSEPGLAFQMEAGPDFSLAASAGRAFALRGSIAPADTTGVTYYWAQEGGPPDAVISNPGSLTANILIPEPGQYTFCLHGAKQGAFLASSSDTITVNHPGVFELSGGSYSRAATAPLAVVLSDAYARFNGQNITTIQWTQLEGDKASIQGATTIHPTVTLPRQGSYRFRCTAATSHSPPFVKSADAVITFSE